MNIILDNPLSFDINNIKFDRHNITACILLKVGLSTHYTIQHIVINVNDFFDIDVLFVGFEECAKDYECSKKCVRAYMKRYGGWKCTNTCQDYARMHVGGPMGCTKPTTLGYWDKIKEKGCNEKS
jgi:hypothetical protein